MLDETKSHLEGHLDQVRQQIEDKMEADGHGNAEVGKQIEDQGAALSHQLAMLQEQTLALASQQQMINSMQVQLGTTLEAHE